MHAPIEAPPRVASRPENNTRARRAAGRTSLDSEKEPANRPLREKMCNAPGAITIGEGGCISSSKHRVRAPTGKKASVAPFGSRADI